MGNEEMKSTWNNKYIIPFSYNTKQMSFEQLIEKNGDDWRRDTSDKTECDIYDYIQQLFFMSEFNEEETVTNNRAKHDADIACIYEYQGKVLSNSKEDDGYGQEKKIREFCINDIKGNHDENLAIRFKICNVKVALFQNGIGLLWYETERKKKFLTLEQSIKFNYNIKELARSESDSRIYEVEPFVKDKPNAEYYLQKSGKEIFGYYPIKKVTLGIVIDQILSSMKIDYTYYPCREKSADNGDTKKKKIPDKALMFNYYATKNKDDIIKAAYYLTNGYKESYKIPQNITDHMFHPFENVYCFVTTEGCGYYVLMDESNESFFDSNAKKLQNDYFRLYLLLLYQFYSSLLYSDIIAKTLPANANRYKKFSNETKKTLIDITTEINVFLAKSVYSTVSYVQQQNDYYNYVANRLRIKDSIDSVKQGLNALEDLELMLHEEEEKKKDSRLQIILAIISILSIVSVIADIVGLIDLFK